VKINKYKKILSHYSNTLKRHGPNLKGLDWKSKKDNLIRFTNIFKIINENKYHNFSLLDFGCGLSDLYLFLSNKRSKFKYDGIDTSKIAIDYCKKKFKKNKYYQLDLLQCSKKFKKYDVIVLNGIFTIKTSISNQDMYDYIFKLIKKLKNLSKGIIIINFLTSFPDWRNKKNFYPDMNKIFSFTKKNISKKFSYYHNVNLHEAFLVIDAS